MFKNLKNNNKRGISIIEIILVIGVSIIVIISIGNLMNSLTNATLASTNISQANFLVGRALEIIIEDQKDLFTCICSTADGCDASTSICTKASDGQTCTLFPSYTSCWTETRCKESVN